MRVFLSHSTKDGAFVKQLAAAIARAGSEAWLCEVDVEQHENFVAAIEKGLKWCDVALLVWSPDAAASKWTEEEWTSVLHRELTEQRVRLGIIQSREHPLPELLRTKNYISAHGDPQAAIRDTLEWLQRRESAQRLSGLHAPVYLPDYRPQDFVGRTAQLAILRRTLSDEPSVFLLHGEPGAGKSTLALQFAWEVQKDFDAVIFQTCGRRPLDTITAELVERLSIDVRTLPPDGQRDAAKQWLRQRQSLLILDDVWPNDDGKIDIRQLEPGPACSVLYTSRLHSLPGVGPVQISRIEKFTDAETEELFHIYLDPVFNKEAVEKNRQPLLEFAARVEMLPIAVAVGASLLREKSAMVLNKAVSKLQVGALADGAKNVNHLFAQAIESQPKREQKLLASCVVCTQEGFWLPLAAQIAELTEDHAEEAANMLVRSSLLRVLDRDRRRFQVHALLREQMRTQLGLKRLTKLEERHATTLEGLFEDWETRWQDCRECLQEIVPTSHFLGGRDESYRAWQLSYKAYKTGRRVGDLDNAFRIMRHEKELATKRGDKVRLKSSCTNLANILCMWGKLDVAMQLHKKQGKICRELGDKDGLQRSYGNQAGILYEWGRPKEALVLLRKQEAMCKRLGNMDALRNNYANQAETLQSLGRLEEAMNCYDKVVAICIRTLSKDALQDAYRCRASILVELGQLENAFAVLRDREAIASELGDKFALLDIYGDQAQILIRWNRLEDAAKLLLKKEAICEELGDKEGLGYCYWIGADIDSAKGNQPAQREKLQQALALFTDLNMSRERDAVQSQLDQVNSAQS